MLHTDRISGNPHSVKPCSAQAVSSLCLRKSNQKPDLQLTGSQIHLKSRPNSGSGKTSFRSVSVSDIHSRRPMSAVPAFRHQDVNGAGERKRSQSVDNPYFPVGHVMSSSATSDCDERLGRILHTKWDSPHQRKKLAAKLPVLGENIHNCVKQDIPSDKHTNHNNLTVDCQFGTTHTLRSSQLLDCLASKPLGCTWTESELKECCEELGITNYFCNSYDHESSSSDCSNSHCHSGTSLGEQIIAMAQDPQPAELPCTLPLELGLVSEPLSSENITHVAGSLEKLIHSRDKFLDIDVSAGDILFGKLNHVCCLTDKPQYLSESTYFGEKYISVSGEPDGNNSHACSIKMLVPLVSPHENEMFQGDSIDGVLEDMIITQKCSMLKNEIPMNAQYSSQYKEERQNLNEQCQNVLKLKHLCTQNPTVLSRTLNAIDDVSSHVGDIKVQHLFPDSVCEDSRVPDSLICETERETDLLQMNLAREECNFDCSDSSEDVGIEPTYGNDIKTVYSGSLKREELNLECLVLGDIDEHDGSSSIRSSGSDAKCSVSNRHVNIGKQGEISHLDLETENNSLLPDQRPEDETDGELLEKPSAQRGFEGNNNVPHNNMCNDSKSEESDKSGDLNTKGSLGSSAKGTEASWLNTQMESPAHQQFLHTPAESAQALKTDLALQLNLTHENVGHDVLEKSNVSFLLDQRNVLSSPQTLDLNLSTVGTSGNSTYDDIVTILKVLEEEQTCSLPKLDGLKLSPNSEMPCSKIFPKTNEVDGRQNASVTSGKLCEILTYLDEVEHYCDATLVSSKNQLQAVKDSTRNNELKLTTVPRMEELLNLSTVDLSHQVLTLQLQLEEKSNSINLLQETLNQQRELTVRNTRNADRDMKTRLRGQKEEYEATIARHQKFIDQLIADKKNLSEKYESLVLELKKSEEYHTNTLKAVDERHSVELQRAREMHAAAEKLNRKRWIDNKTQRIKEMTVKSLEPELQRMNIRHQQELSDLRLLHKQELDELELRATRKTAQQMEQLRDKLTAEKEEALAKEKEFLRQRIEKQAEQEELEYQARRRRLLAEIHREKERLTEEERRISEQLEETKQNLSRENAKVIERLKQEYQETVEEYTRRHQNEIKSLKEALEIEKEAWINSYKKDQATYISRLESEIRNQCKRERDKDIELVIERLEAEATQSKTELEQATDNRLRRLKEKFDAEIKDLELSEKAIKTKYNEAKGKLVEKEDEVINLKANARQLQKELEEARKIIDKLSAERAELKEIVRKEVMNQVTAAEQENIRLREEMAELRMRHKLELSGKDDEVARRMADKERQLQQVYSRVKVVVTKRDETVQNLKSQYESALDRCSHLEELLEQQRRDFLLK
ncbi:uncharacterized protein LOC111869461 isoform X2 [Cryptotermes secundus]|nr:uncharacterized protein LOC111869461 isoform X2 [Cryptotermes secundus]